MSPDVAVVIVTHNSSLVVPTLLDSLPEALGGLAGEIVVVDNGSSDDTVALLKRRGDCRVIAAANLGYAAGINRGARACPDAHYVLALNPDVVLRPGSVTSMVAALERTGAGVVAPLVRDLDGSVSWSLRREPTLLRALGLGRTHHPALAEYVTAPEDYAVGHWVEWALGAVLLVSRPCHEALGGWDESFFLYSEETDFCLRAGEFGYGVWFDPSAEATHVGGASGTNAFTHSMQITNRVRLYRRRHRLFSSVLYYILAILAELSWWCRGNPYSLEAVRALMNPSRRPPQLGLSGALVPR